MHVKKPADEGVRTKWIQVIPTMQIKLFLCIILHTLPSTRHKIF
jgi:hypothetical protein